MSTASAPAQNTQDAIASDILGGRLAPDTWLRLGALRASYGIGLGPLREAMANLVGRGLVIQEVQRGFRVAPVSLPDLLDLCETRTMLECRALRAALETGSVDWEASILAAWHRLSRHPRTAERLIDEDWEARHRAFHFALLEACPSPRLLAFCHQLYDQFDRYRRLAVLAAGRHPTIDPVEAGLVEAVLAQDADAALALTARHIADSTAQIRQLGTPRWFAAEAGTEVALDGPRGRNKPA